MIENFRTGLFRGTQTQELRWTGPTSELDNLAAVSCRDHLSDTFCCTDHPYDLL